MVKNDGIRRLLRLIFICLVLGGLWAFWQWPDGNFHLVFCDVGQGDAILMSRGTTQILVDGGPDDRVLSCLGEHMPFWDRSLEMVILTHPDKDHGEGLISVIERYKVKYFVGGVLGNPTLFYQKLLDTVSKSNAQLINTWQGDKLAIDMVKILFFWPNKDWVDRQLSDTMGEDLQDGISKGNIIYQKSSGAILGIEDPHALSNNFCLVFEVSYGDFNALLTGDADSRIQPEILATTVLPQVNVLKVAHHGSKYAFLDSFLAQVRPELGVISVGKNPWGHPNQELLDQLHRFGIVIKRTDKEGTIEVVSDGKRWWMVR